MAFGFGDGGGGPQYEMIEMARRCKDLDGCPKMEMTTVSRFMQELDTSLQEPPVYQGELYLELHRGSLTNQHDIKRENRKAEIVIRDTEYFAVCDAVLRDEPTDPARLRPLMETLLVNQFHDILPGTCIHDVHVQARRELSEVRSGAEEYSHRVLAQRADPAGGITVINTLSFPRNDVLFLDTDGHMLATDHPQQVVHNLSGEKRLAVSNMDIDAFSTQYFPFGSVLQSASTPFHFEGKTLETPVYTVRFDDRMRIVSLFDREARREIAGHGLPLGTLLYGEDVPLDWDNWDIDGDQSRKLTDCAALERWEVQETGAVCFALRLFYRFEDGTGVEELDSLDRARVKLQICVRIYAIFMRLSSCWGHRMSENSFNREHKLSSPS